VLLLLYYGLLPPCLPLLLKKGGLRDHVKRHIKVPYLVIAIKSVTAASQVVVLGKIEVGPIEPL
jgi:hypothetical protein